MVLLATGQALEWEACVFVQQLRQRNLHVWGGKEGVKSLRSFAFACVHDAGFARRCVWGVQT
jgi:hypothetical protein